MDEVLQFLKENATFYLATVEGSVPKVRPFGFVMKYEGKLCFCTNSQKDVYEQLKANPKFEISTTSQTGEWIRLSGKATFISTEDAKRAVLKEMPSLERRYSVDDPTFEVFYADEAEATFNNYKDSPRTIKL
jgi:uncharacterized pyridoxamine 5'-phosphate oxidase family protein